MFRTEPRHKDFVMQINYRRARNVFALMLDRYRAGEYPFINIDTDLPQNLVASEFRVNPLQHALHLFCCCYYMRGTVISSDAFKIMNDLHREFPWLFNEEVLMMTTQHDIQAALNTRIKWHSNQISGFWLANARTLWNEWDGDPRNIFAGQPSKRTLYKRVVGKKYRPNGQRLTNRHEGFQGFQEKMTSMLAYFLESTKLIGPTPLSAPVDFHHLRVYLATQMIEIVSNRVRYEKVKPLGIKLAEYLQREFGLSQTEYGDIIWLWSLRSCKRSPHNASRKFDRDDGREQRMPIPVVWTKNQVAAYTRTCGRCYIHDYCGYGVPAGVYYTTGVFELVRRNAPPQARIFNAVDLPYAPAPTNGVRDEFRARFEIAAE